MKSLVGMQIALGVFFWEATAKANPVKHIFSDKRVLSCGVYELQSQDPDTDAPSLPPTAVVQLRKAFVDILNSPSKSVSVQGAHYILNVNMSPDKSSLYYSLSSTTKSLAVHGNWLLGAGRSKRQTYSVTMNTPSLESMSTPPQKVNVTCRVE